MSDYELIGNDIINKRYYDSALQKKQIEINKPSIDGNLIYQGRNEKSGYRVMKFADDSTTLAKYQSTAKLNTGDMIPSFRSSTNYGTIDNKPGIG